MPTTIRVLVDSDNAGDRETRRSTVGEVIKLGQHAVKHNANMLSVVGLSSAENEYYGISRGAASGLGMQSMLADWGLELSVQVASDSSAARGFASRRGLGKMKHIQTRFLWVQERLALKHLSLAVVPTADNEADLLTKALPASRCRELMSRMGQVFRGGRSLLAKKLIGK